jgi:hypothetical protein
VHFCRVDDTLDVEHVLFGELDVAAAPVLVEVLDRSGACSRSVLIAS